MISRELLAGPIVATIFVRRILPIKQLRRENSSCNVLFSVEHRRFIIARAHSWFAKTANTALWKGHGDEKVTNLAFDTSRHSLTLCRG